MKEVKPFIITDFIIAIIKILTGLFASSMSLIAAFVDDIILIINSLIAINSKKNNKIKSILTSLFGIIICIISLGIIYITFINKIFIPSILIIPIIILCVFISYGVNCYYTNTNYNKKSGKLIYSNKNSNLNFLIYIIIIISVVLSKFNRLFTFFKYSDRLATILICLIIIKRGIKIITNSFKMMEDKTIIPEEEIKQEIIKSKEINQVNQLQINSFGGINYINAKIILAGNINMLDLNTFVMSLQDYLLKYANYISIEIYNKNSTKWGKKLNARNSGSRNSKTNTKKKNSRKKNKKS